MDKHYKNIRGLIESNLVEEKKQDISKNHHKLQTYYNVGKEIIEAQGGAERAKRGNELIKKYSLSLTEEFGVGYDVSNLKRMRQLYLLFPKGGPPGHLFTKLTWTHFRMLLPIKDEKKRNYYINSVIAHNFSKRQLKEHMKSEAYERLENKGNIKLKYLDDESENDETIVDMIKNPIRIIMTKAVDKITEKALKLFILEQIEKMMLELGKGFAFVGSEVPIKINGKTLRPDLVFFNYEINSFVIIELKINELTIKDIGQIEFYVNYYDSEVKKHFHNQTIGITISKRVDEEVIKYNKKPNTLHTTYEMQIDN